MAPALIHAFPGFASEARWLRHVRENLGGTFRPAVAAGCTLRLRRLYPTKAWVMSALARAADVGTDGVWVVDSTSVECRRSRKTAQYSDLATGLNTGKSPRNCSPVHRG